MGPFEGQDRVSITLLGTIFGIVINISYTCIDKVRIMKYDYNKLNLESFAKESESLADMLRKLSIPVRGRNYDTLKKYINLYKIDISHFDGEKQRLDKLKAIQLKKKRKIEEYLIENKPSNSSNLKDRLYTEGYKKRICELCGQDEIWKDKKMSLILDHINGNHSDNRIENLRIVCPNCNATLDTHCGKNITRRKINYCKCGIEINKQSKVCQSCSGNKRRKVQRPDIEILKKEVDDIGYSAVGRKYNVSDNAIRKWLK